MKLYLAPMEGVTGYAYRRALNRYFPGIDRFFTPFISAQKNLNTKQERDVNPANNEGMELIPQFMAHRAQDVLEMQALLRERYGYEEINLNQGCPSGTVVSKNHGSGFLRDTVVMDHFLEELFSRAGFPVSIKTRVGVESEEEWNAILEVYQKYPLSELIIHPRTTRDQYSGKPRLGAFAKALERLDIPVCYNGDINSLQDYIKVKSEFPTVDRVMIGRGVIKNPFLLNEIAAYEESGEQNYVPGRPDWDALRAMMQEIRTVYEQTFSAEAHVLAHMKELWGYLANGFPEAKKEIKMLKKSRKLAEYDAVVNLLFAGK